MSRKENTYNERQAFIEFTNWMNTVRKFNIQDEHKYISEIMNYANT